MASLDNIEGINAALARPDYVPQGITAAFLLQNRDRPAIIATLFTAAFAALVVALRCYARIVIVRKFGLDDRLALLTLVGLTFFIIGC
jgi:small neutral amino acid transporter SnatA (MarC family)